MSVIATALKHLMAAGVSGDDLLRAVAELEAEIRAEPKPRSNGALRTQKWRERKASQASHVTDGDGCDEGDGGDASPALSRPPNENNSNPPTHTHPEGDSPREEPNSHVLAWQEFQARRQKRPRKATRLGEDWKPGPLPAAVAALVQQWPLGRLERELDGFRDYWLSRNRDPARTDWERTWHNRIRDQHDRVMRDYRNDRNRHLPSHRADEPSALERAFAERQAERAADLG